MTFLSCKAQKVGQEAIYGTFYKLDKDKHFSTSYTLKLNSDSTFSFLIKVKDGQPQCNGTWELVDNEFIHLKCYEITDVTEALSSGYMNQREHKLQVVNRNKLKYKDVVLKRKK
jgi:hypothetical protein